MEERIFSVTEIGNIIKRIFDSEELLNGIQVTGEVTNFKISGGHAYFTLKDDTGSLSCTFFNIHSSQYGYIAKDGEKVVVKGRPSYYVKGGRLNFNAIRMKPMGMGDLHLKYLALKERLEKEGLFDASHKKPIPTFPKKIGVVTSPTGAVLRDIYNVTKRRNPFVDICIFPAKVQGKGGDIEVEKGIKTLDEHFNCDVIIVARGGGSFEDLENFYQERVVRAVYNAKTPIISAVGHETDFSLCDFAADLRAPTPSAAAELAVPHLVSMIKTMAGVAKELQNKVIKKIGDEHKIVRTTAEKLILLSKNTVNKMDSEIRIKSGNMLNVLRALYVSKVNSIKLISSEIENKNPLKLLRQGYAKVFKIDSEIKSIKQVKVGEDLTIRMEDGKIVATVKDKEEIG